MDLTTLTPVVMLAISAVGLDTVWHRGDVIPEPGAAGKLDKSSLDVGMLNRMPNDAVYRVSVTQSVVARPCVRTSSQSGIGMAIATAVNLRSVAYERQAQFDDQPDDIKLALGDANGAGQLVAPTDSENPRRAIAGRRWADVKREKGDAVPAGHLRQTVPGAAAFFENHVEVAAPCLQLAWRDHLPVINHQIRNSAVGLLH